MAQVIIYPTAINSSTWTLFGTGNGVTAMQDGDATTGYNNYNPLFVHTLFMNSTGAKPADMVGATITVVELYFGLDAPLNKGTFTALVNGTSAGALTAPFSPGYKDVTSFKSWTHNDFYIASTTWGLQSDGNADDSTKFVSLTECHMRVTYTPVSTPVAAFTVSTTTGTSPLSVQFTDQGSNTPTSWLWSFGDGNTAANQHPLYVYTTVGTYTVTLTETNGGGTGTLSTASLITVLTAAAPVDAEFNASPLSGVQNLGVKFTDYSTGTPAASSWSWQFGDGAVSTTQNPTHVYTTVGTYTVTLTASNITPTSDTKTRSSFISVANGKPIPSAAASTTTGVKPLSVQFTGSATNALPTAWSWDFGDLESSVAQSPLHVYTTVGTFTPVLTVTNEIGTASTTVGPITVAFNTITARFTFFPTMGYAPLTVRFKDQSVGDPASWAWTFGDTGTSVNQFPVHVYASTATATETPTLIASSYQAAVVNNLINYWRLEEATGTGVRVDSWGSNDLTPTLTVTQVSGKKDLGVQVGSARFVRKTSGFTNTAAYSVAGWIWRATLGGTNGIWGSTVGATDAAVNLVSGKFQIVNNATQTSIISRDTLTWYHLVFTYDGDGTYNLYVNGELDITFTGGIAASASDFGLGGSGGSGVTIFDEVSRYSVELAQYQAVALYNDGKGLFLDTTNTNGGLGSDSVCVLNPDRTWGMFFEEMKYQLLEPVAELDVCTGFTAFGGMAKAVELTQQRLERFVIETAVLRKEATLAAAITDTEDFALPTDLIELLRVEVDGVPFYPADPYQRDRVAMNSTYIVNDALTITVPGVFGTTPTIKVWYTYVPSAPTVPSPCTCPSTPGSGPWVNFPLPYVLWWIIRYGVIADMLTQAGERNDPARAGECEKLFNSGVEIYKLLYRSF